MSLGWHYPPGAERDPRAPFNEKECPRCGDAYYKGDEHECPDEDEEAA